MTNLTHYLCWDIDGTLLSTARAGILSLEKAAREMTGQELDLRALPTAGLTDGQIARSILVAAGGEGTDREVTRLLGAYEEDLPRSLPLKKGQVLPGVREILAAVNEDPQWGSMLLTGNTARGAAAKLAHYGLDRFFPGPGAFSDGASQREDIARRAMAMIAREAPAMDRDHVVVIGDTIHDVACAKAVGCRCLGVTTGGGSRADLHRAGADVVVPQLPSAAEFRELIHRLSDQRA